MKPLPNTSKWQPKQDKADWLQTAFIEQCIYSEQTILTRLEFEKKVQLQTFDVGIPFEDVVLNEFSKLFPKRYNVTNGIVSDSNGLTAGDCDFIIFNDIWFPYVISGATNSTRKKFLPIEGVYAIGEIKTKLTEETLDNACEKLVKTSRLNRKRTNSNRIVENRDDGCQHGLTNPLYSFIFAASIDSHTQFLSLVERFVLINSKLKRSEIIRGLCVLGEGVITWGYHDRKTGEGKPAMFMRKDLYEPIFPVFVKFNQKTSTIYPLIVDVHAHLFQSVLAPEDFALLYGTDDYPAQRPESDSFCIKPDDEWIKSIESYCKADNHQNHSNNPWK